MPYLDDRLTLSVRVEPDRRRPHVARRGGELRVRVRRPADVRDALERWYRREARGEIERRLDAAVARAGSAYTKLSIRGQKTRWASCSSSGAMSFNWRLLLGPEAILDYVIEHEVAHLEIHDHSQAFWELLAQTLPGLPRARAVAARQRDDPESPVGEHSGLWAAAARRHADHMNPSHSHSHTKRLYRSNDRVIAGVCSGLARYFNIDPIIVRVAAVAGLLAGGVTLVAYVAALILVPVEPGEGEPEPPRAARSTVAIVAIVVAALVAFADRDRRGFVLAGVILPFAFLAAAGIAAWWAVSGEGPGRRAGRGGQALPARARGAHRAAAPSSSLAGGPPARAAAPWRPAW